MKRLLILIGVFNLVALVALSLGMSHRTELAMGIWQHLHAERLATALDRQNPVLAFTIAEYYFNHGSYDVKKAEIYYTHAIELDPGYKEAYYQRGRIFFIRGRFADALLDIDTVLRLDPEFKKAYYMYGLVHGYLGNTEQAEYGFSEFIKRDSFNWAGYNDLAWVYFKQGDYEKTRDTAALGLKHAPNNPWLNNIYGTALMNLGQKAEAKAALETALRESEQLTPADWGRSYPGNDPSIYAAGLEETRSVIRHNLALLEK